MSIIRVKQEKGVLKPLDRVDFEECEEPLVKIMKVDGR